MTPSFYAESALRRVHEWITGLIRKPLGESNELLGGIPAEGPNRRRRRVLATSGGVVLSAVAGRLGGRSPAPDGMEVETRHWAADILEEGSRYQRQKREVSIDRYHELVADETAAQRRIDEDENEDVTASIEGTDLAESYLVVVQNMMQSARWFELRQIQRTDRGLDIVVATASPDGPSGDDAAVHSLAIRVTDEQADTPGELHVTIDGKPTAT